MCYFKKQEVDLKNVAYKYKATLPSTLKYPTGMLKGFDFPEQPIVLAGEAQIKLGSWGLIPYWAKESSIRQYTLNAKIETLELKPSFRDIINKRCLVFASAFYESKWLDDKGKSKERYEITNSEGEFLVFGGLYDRWVNKQTSEVILSYTILTTEAKGLMREIHNSQKRMPVMLNSGQEEEYLSNRFPLSHYASNELHIHAQCLSPSE